MKSSQLEKLCTSVCRCVEDTAGFIRGESGKVKSGQIETKALNSLVSYVDRTAETQLVHSLRQLLPEAVFLTEEKTVPSEAGEYRWIIDPLDGTTNFLHQIPCFAVSVGLEYDQSIILGIVYEVNQRECFYAWKGGGAFLNGQRIQVSTASQLGSALIATGFPYRDYSRMESYFEALRYFIKNSRGLRRMGAAAVDLAYLACGRFDVFFEYGLSPWDVAAGTLLVEEAGGCISDFSGQRNFIYGEEMLATNHLLFRPVLEYLMPVFV